VGTYDFFAVGVDCCTCPNKNFQCGEWKNPLARGGSRSLTTNDRPLYKLAVDQWSATYMKAVKHPLFFNWEQDPVYRNAWNKQWSMDVAVLAVTIPIPFLMGAVLLLDALRQLLVRHNLASTTDTPHPPRGFEKLWENFFPSMRKYGLDQHRQLLGIPVTEPPNYGSFGRAPGGAGLGVEQWQQGQNSPPAIGGQTVMT
jgi:hypothetical protein